MNSNVKLDAKLLKQAAQQYQTPCYIYDKQQIINNYTNYKTGFIEANTENYLICYAVKANSNLSILRTMAELGSGFDIVSGGELARVLKAGGKADRIVFSGVGKQDEEIKAALVAGIYCFNVESEPELRNINSIAQQMNVTAPVSIRVNPDIDAKSHPYISTGLKEHKFGIAIEQAEKLYNIANDFSHLKITGIDCHIGSQLTELSPLKDTCLAINKLLAKLTENNIAITHINLGGGLGIDYGHNNSSNLPSQSDWVRTIIDNLDFKQKIILEPGRSIVGNAGVLLTTVLYNKQDTVHHRNFTIVDAAMNDLMRPALYCAEHKIINLNTDPNHTDKSYKTTIVGPICESSDVFAKEINLDNKAGDVLAILDTGAYGFSMSSNYNTRPKACELLIDNQQIKLIRARETIEDLYKLEL